MLNRIDTDFSCNIAPRSTIHSIPEGRAVLPVLATPALKFQAPELWDNTEGHKICRPPVPPLGFGR